MSRNLINVYVTLREESTNLYDKMREGHYAVGVNASLPKGQQGIVALKKFNEKMKLDSTKYEITATAGSGVELEEIQTPLRKRMNESGLSIIKINDEVSSRMRAFIKNPGKTPHIKVAGIIAPGGDTTVLVDAKKAGDQTIDFPSPVDKAIRKIEESKDITRIPLRASLDAEGVTLDVLSRIRTGEITHILMVGYNKEGGLFMNCSSGTTHEKSLWMLELAKGWIMGMPEPDWGGSKKT